MRWLLLALIAGCAPYYPSYSARPRCVSGDLRWQDDRVVSMCVNGHWESFVNCWKDGHAQAPCIAPAAR